MEECWQSKPTAEADISSEAALAKTIAGRFRVLLNRFRIPRLVLIRDGAVYPSATHVQERLQRYWEDAKSIRTEVERGQVEPLPPRPSDFTNRALVLDPMDADEFWFERATQSTQTPSG